MTSVRSFVSVFAVSLATFFALDLLWLGVVAAGFYQDRLATLLRPDVWWPPALIFYLLFVAGIVHFVTVPAIRAGSRSQAALSGALFGVVTYAAFDLTCLALVRDFPVDVALVDLVWGGVLTAAVATVGCTFSLRTGIPQTP